MKRNGFTLIELIVTIALLGIIGIVVSVNMVNVMKNENKKEEERVISLIEEAACSYAGLSTSVCINGCNISGNTLIKEGLIDEVINNVEIKDYNVNITYVNGERICEATKNEG